MDDPNIELLTRIAEALGDLRERFVFVGGCATALITDLLFLKMADERSRPPYNQPSPIPRGYDW